jgi:GxxExxY protein
MPGMARLSAERLNRLTEIIIGCAIRIPVQYRGVRIPCGFKADLIVEGAVIVEVKSVERLAPIRQAKMITYLRLADCPLGLILNFNNTVMKDGIRRLVNNFPESRGAQEGTHRT